MLFAGADVGFCFGCCGGFGWRDGIAGMIGHRAEDLDTSKIFFGRAPGQRAKNFFESGTLRQPADHVNAGRGESVKL
jgi:hypothetical protein